MDDIGLEKRLLRIQFLKAQMTDAQKAAYESLSKQLHYADWKELQSRRALEAQAGHDTRLDTHQNITVPANIRKKRRAEGAGTYKAGMRSVGKFLRHMAENGQEHAHGRGNRPVAAA